MTLRVAGWFTSLAALLVSGVVASALAARGEEAGAQARAAARDLERAVGGPVAIRWSSSTGMATFVGAPEGRLLPPTLPAAPAAERAKAFVATHGRLFGIGDATEVAVVRVTGPDEVGMEHVRLRQLQDGVPVTAGELIVHLRGGALLAANGKTLPPQAVGVVPAVPAEAVGARVQAALGADLDLAGATFGVPRLELFNAGLLLGGATPTRLAWFVEATTAERREFVWIDAQRGDVLLHFNQAPDALDRRIHDAMHTGTVPGTLVRSEGDPPTGDAEIDRAYDYTGDTYAYFLTVHGRDSFDDAGATMIATVRYCAGGVCPWDNAQWLGGQTRYGDNTTVDDIVAHEWTHAVTEYSAGLLYIGQSGALNESYSDIFGETVDLGNGSGLDTPAERWELFEDLPPPGFHRNLMDPTLYGDPGKLSDPQVICDPLNDLGGVHTNSGIGNHAYALMVDGGTYNGVTVAGIGLAKAERIEYRTLTAYLGLASTFLDKYDALPQACADLVGTAGITAGDCAEATRALDAVEMGSAWPCFCGDGALVPGEQCDDGNTTDGDCCSSRCTLEGIGSPCDDGHPCTSGDACDGQGACLAGLSHAGCRRAGASLLVLKDGATDARDTLIWKWRKGASTAVADFGAPASTTAYTLCLFAGAGEALIAEMAIPPDAGKWAALGAGYKYSDAAGLPQGIEKVVLKSGAAGRAKVLVRGQGVHLPLPSLGAGLALPVKAQLLNSSPAVCFESAWEAGEVSENGGSQFRAKVR